MTSDLLNIFLTAESPQIAQQQLQGKRGVIESLSPEEIDDLLADTVSELKERPGSYARSAAAIQLFISFRVASEIQNAKSADLVGADRIEDDDAEGGIEVESGEPWSAERLESIEDLYRNTPPESDLKNQLLQWLAVCGDPKALELWADLITDAPPQHRLGLVLAFSPLMRSEFEPPEWLQTRLLNEGTIHMQIAPLVFDLFNFWFRSNKVAAHPAAPRFNQLVVLFGQLVGQLGKIEEGNFRDDVDLLTLNLQISDSVALVVSLCDFFGLLESKDAVLKLHQAMSLKHRRVQTEAAAALAKLGDDSGKELLMKMVEEPVARLRVLNYASELGFLDEISLEWQGEIAMAESHLAIWLSDPRQVGFAPAEIQLIDSREMSWPSYDHPVMCYLFDYKYGLKETAPGNVGICGPMTHAFEADLRGLDHMDMYAAFAGWQTVHKEVFQTTIERARLAAPEIVSHLEARLGQVEDGVVEGIAFVGSFFGQWILVAAGETKAKSATLMVEQDAEYWIDSGNGNAPIDAMTAWAIVKGRKLLAHFNPEVDIESA
jgi:hypothetical protein